MRRSSSSDEDSSNCLRARDLFLGMVPPVPPAGQLPSKQGEDSQKKSKQGESQYSTGNIDLHRCTRESFPVEALDVPGDPNATRVGNFCDSFPSTSTRLTLDFLSPFRSARRQREEEMGGSRGTKNGRRQREEIGAAALYARRRWTDAPRDLLRAR